jgi:type II secretory pathway pseudopilin PulG
MKDSNQPKSGATLLEILLVLSLISLLAGLALSTVRAWQVRSRTLEIPQALTADIIYAQGSALRQGRSVGLVLETQGSPVYRVCVDADGDGLSRSDIEAGLDVCPGPEIRLERPPWIQATDVRWGAHRMIVCNAWGLCTSATTCWAVPPFQERWCLVWNGTMGQTRWERSRSR